MAADHAGNGGRSYARRSRLSVAEQGSSLLSKRARPVVARAKPKEADAEDTDTTEDMRFKQRPRIRLREQDGTLPPLEDVAAAIKAADALFGQEDESAEQQEETYMGNNPYPRPAPGAYKAPLVKGLTKIGKP